MIVAPALDCWGECNLTEQDDAKEPSVESIAAYKNDDVIAECRSDDQCDISIVLGTETIQKIEKLERYAILAGHRIGEFRVG